MKTKQKNILILDIQLVHITNNFTETRSGSFLSHATLSHHLHTMIHSGFPFREKKAGWGGGVGVGVFTKVLLSCLLSTLLMVHQKLHLVLQLPR